jgi:hypothetical protein
MDNVEYGEKDLIRSIPTQLAVGMDQLPDKATNEESFQLLSAPRLKGSNSSLSADDASNGVNRSDDGLHDHMRHVNLHESSEEPVDPSQPLTLEASNPVVDEESEIVEDTAFQAGAAPTRSDSEAEVSWRGNEFGGGPAEREPSSTQQLLPQSHDVYAASDLSYDTMTATTDSAFAWISDTPEDPPDIPSGHPLLLFEDVSFRVLWRGYQVWRQSVYGQSEASGSINRPEPPKKRSRIQHEKDEYDEDGQDGERDTPSRGPHASHKKRKVQEVTFSCPFFKKDPMAHSICCKYVLTRIRDVKQHLARRHQMPIYCPRCIQIFSDENLRDSHVRNMTCQPVPYGTLEGITEGQKKQLAKKAPANQTSEAQWFGIFDILFPNHQPKPESPYMDTELFQNVIGYQSFLVSHGPRILEDILTRHGSVAWNLPNGDADLQAFRHRLLQDGFRMIFQQWTSQGASARGQPRAANATTRTVNETSQQATPGPSTTAASSYGEEPALNYTPASASSHVASEAWSWYSEGELLANLNLNNAADSGINPITATDTQDINDIFATDVGLMDHIRYPS